jgi:Ca2+-transporting ATPase
MGVIIGGGASGDSTQGGSDIAYIKGALEQVLVRCDTYLTKDGREVILDEPRRKAAREAAEKMASEGLRVIAFASGPVRESGRNQRRLGSRSATPSPKIGQAEDDDRFNGLVFAGLVGMTDPPRKDVHKSIRRLMAGGVKVVMITGDAESTAVAIARQLGMPINDKPGGHPVLRGDQIDHMSMGELAEVISTTTIFARTSPEHKLKIVRALQSRGDVVAMTGDGVNDAPALKKADIGISMGKLGTDVAKEAADMILTDDDFSTILRAIEQGKGIFYNIQNFITFQLSTSVAALGLVLLSTTLGFQNPLNAMQILWISEWPGGYFISVALLIIDRHHHGRPTRAIPRCRTCRSRRHEPSTTTENCTSPHETTDPARPDFCPHHHARHIDRIHTRNGRHRRRIATGQTLSHCHQPRHDYDIHLLRFVRYVQRSHLP